MLLLHAWAAAPYLAQLVIDGFSGKLNEPSILRVLRRAADHLRAGR